MNIPMKKYVVSLILLVAFGLYLAFGKQSSTAISEVGSVAVTGNPTGTIKNPDIGNINPIGGSSSGENENENENDDEGENEGGIVNNPTTTGGATGTTGATGSTGNTGGGTGGTSGGTTTGGSGTTAGAFKDGTYTGSVADAIFGALQVKITVQGGALTDITFPQYPNDSGHTREVSNSSLPILRQEAISAQSANVHVVSGATQTSDAFKESLASALSQAKA